VIRTATATERVLDAFASEKLAVRTIDIPPSRGWKHDLAPYLEADRARSLGQIASVVLPYFGVWVLASLSRPGAWLAIGLGLIAIVLLVRTYSLFHDLTHNSLFGSRQANSRWGYLLGFLLFTPYGWWQRQHSLHHAGSGNLDKRGAGEIYTMTLHQDEDTYFRAAGEWNFELAALQGSSHLELPRPLARAVGNANYHHVHHLSARIPNYNLRAAHEQQPMFARTPVVTVPRPSIEGFAGPRRPQVFNDAQPSRA
jgi:fatty acid desaturase